MYILGCKNRKTASGIQTYHQAWIPDAVFLLFTSEPAETWCKKAGKGYSMLFKDSVMLMFSSRRDMAMLTMKAKTKVRITARA